MLLFQIPPTPTPFAGNPNLPDLIVPDSWVWDAAPETVGLWNSANRDGFLSLVQVFILAIAVMLFIGLLLMVIRRIGND